MKNTPTNLLCRTIGAATAKKPMPISIISSDNSLNGYAGGVNTKK